MSDAPILLTDVTAVLLAAGRGSRMGSALPKVLHPLAGRPMLLHLLHAVHEAGLREVVVVTGHEEPLVRATVSDYLAADGSTLPGLHLRYAHQAEPRGTGDAVLRAREAVATEYALILNGDLGLLTSDLLRPLLAEPACDAALAVATVDNPTGLGRVVRDHEGTVQAIVEEAEAETNIAALCEINVGIYRFRTDWLWPTLEALPVHKGGEVHVTDAIAQTNMRETVRVALPNGQLNIDSRKDLARAEAVIRKRTIDHWLEEGVTVRDPATTYIDADVTIGPDTVLEPGVHLSGHTVVGPQCRIGPNAILRSTQVGAGCVLDGCTITEATLGDRVEVGPYSTLRAGTVLDNGVHVGTHAEIKNARLGAGAMMGHFSYVGDAEIGPEANIGAGAITCNFDGEQKHRTVIGARAFIGSGSLLIAPVNIGEGASTGAGAVVTRDVPPGKRVTGHPARQRGREERSL